MATNSSNITTRVIPSLVEMTPYQIYLQQVKGSVDMIRYTLNGLNYFPPQIGGLDGQLAAMNSTIVLQLIDFQIGDGKSNG